MKVTLKIIKEASMYLMRLPLAQSIFWLVKHTAIVAASVFILGIAAFSQNAAEDQIPATTTVTPYVHDLRGISIGMEPDEVLEKLGKPRVSDNAGMLFSFSNKEMVQIGIGPKGKVRTIALIFEKSTEDTPDLEDIFGPTAEATVNEDGSVYKMVRYEKQGFWLAYNRSGGKTPMTTVTMRRIEP